MLPERLGSCRFFQLSYDSGRPPIKGLKAYVAAHRTVRIVLGLRALELYDRNWCDLCHSLRSHFIAGRDSARAPHYGVGDGLGTPPGTGSVTTGLDGEYGGGVTAA